MSHITYDPVRQAMQQLQSLSEDEETRYLAEMRERALITEQLELSAAHQRGMEKGERKGERRGEKKGIKKGIKKGMALALQSLLASGMPEEQARAILHL